MKFPLPQDGTASPFRSSRPSRLSHFGTALLVLGLLLTGAGPLMARTGAGVSGKSEDRPGACARERMLLAPAIARLGRDFDGRVGIAVRKRGCVWTVGHAPNRLMPQQSVSKLWVAMAALNAVDRGRLSLDRRVALSRDDFVVFNQPLRALVLQRGRVVLKVRDLITHSLIHSDNLANDRLLRLVGGPEAVRAMLRRKGLEGIGFGPGERLLQSRTAGLVWRPSYAADNNFDRARARLPMATRRAALRRYLDDPADGATAAGIVWALTAVHRGDVLSPSSRAFLLNVLGRVRSGPMRLKAGAPPGWTVRHKTGTGQILGATATGFNDVALIESPGGDSYAIAVLIAETTQPIAQRTKLMQTVSRTVAATSRQARLSMRSAGAGAGAKTLR